MPAFRSTDITIKGVRHSTQDFRYRTPIKFGGVVVDRVTLLNVEVEVESPSGKKELGKASMPLGNVWSFPSKILSYETTLMAMRQLAEEIATAFLESKLTGHPIEIGVALEPEALQIARNLSTRLGLAEPIPPLATLVTVSPFDAAMHDAYGKLHGLSTYQTYGKDFLDNNLGRFLGTAFRNISLTDFVSPHPVPCLPMYHLVGAVDPISSADVRFPVGDGLPESLIDWIRAEGLTHLKIKLNGDNLAWDVERVLQVEAAAISAKRESEIASLRFSLDFNEQCRSVDYLLAFLERLRAGSPAAFGRIAYIEQPTRRDLKADRANEMHLASSQIPVVIDEALIDLESLLLAQEMGYTGVALKACKGQTQSILLAGAAKHLGMSLCVQDLTCPGASLIHSVGLAAHLPDVTAIEANSRQFCPAANKSWISRFPGIFIIREGTIRTDELGGPGLGAFD